MDAQSRDAKSVSGVTPVPGWLQFTGLSDRQIIRWYLPAAFLAATFVSYSAALPLGFVFDDHVLILTNDSIRSWRYFGSYFASHIWAFRYPHLLSNYYRPLFLVWLRLNDALFGLRPSGWHLTSVLAHVAVTYLVYRLSLRLTRDGWVAGAAGLLFGLHPVHAEAVADITSIQEPLSSLFLLGAILTFCRSRDPGAKLGWLGGSLVLAAAALLSKESGLMLPILISAYVWIYAGATEGESIEGRTRLSVRLRSALVAAIPFWAVVLIYVPLRVRALRGFAHVVTPLSLSREIFTIPSVLVFYLRLLIWPSRLSCYYDTPYVSTPGWHNFALPVALLSALAGGLVIWHRYTRPDEPRLAQAIGFASLFTALTLLPVLNFRFLPEGEIAHDRYVYLPSVGFVILLALALRRVKVAVARASVGRVCTLLGALMLSAAMGIATARQCLVWSDDLTLNYRAHEIAPRNISATTSLAAAVAGRGMDGAAMELYKQALAIQPEFWRANVNLAYLYYAHGDFADAAQFFARACDSDPTDGDQFLYLGMALLRMGRLAEAEKAVRMALMVRSQGKNYHLGLGMVLIHEGRLSEAREEILQEVSEDPQNSAAKDLLDKVTEQMKPQAARSSDEHARKAN